MSDNLRKAEKAVKEAENKLKTQIANAGLALEKRKQTYPSDPNPKKTVERAIEKHKHTLLKAQEKYDNAIADIDKKYG